MNPYRDDPLYRECIPTKPSGTPNTLDGPTACFRQLEIERERWSLLHEMAEDDEAVA